MTIPKQQQLWLQLMVPYVTLGVKLYTSLTNDLHKQDNKTYWQ
jgi:hypothetical protein